jgi:hypothetical protein
MTRDCKSVLLLIALAGFVSACSVQGEISDTRKTKTITVAGQAAEFVSSSTQGETTAGGYKVFSSTGNRIAPATGNSLVETTAGGYVVYVSVQGNNSTESVTTVTQ